MRLSLDMGMGSLATMGSGSGWTPISLGSSLIAWWTADRADLMTLSGSQVSSWRDVVAGYNAVQAVSGSRPVYSAGSFNGAPGVTFDGLDDCLEIVPAPAAFPSGSAGGEMWAVVDQAAQTPSDTSSRRPFSYGNLSATRRTLRRAVSGGVSRGGFGAGNGTTETLTLDMDVEFTGRHLMRGVATATGAAVAIDGEPLPAETAGVPATTLERMRLGANPASGSGSDFWLGQLRDIIITGPLTGDEVVALTAWALPRRML